MIALTIIATVVAAAGYFCLAVQIGLMVSDWTEGTGFDGGFYMMTTLGLLALPFALMAQFAQ